MKTPPSVLAKNRVWKHRNREQQAAYHRQRHGRCTPDQFNTALAEQDNRCGICREVFTGTPCADHDHITKRFRGLLCQACNLGIGKFNDSVLKLEAAIAWLTK